ncbi:MAG TPA: Crp/Fnr family transcriptional regulator [Terriglobales bacterium]
MANASSRLRVKPTSKPPPYGVDGHALHNEILLGLPGEECDSVFSKLQLVQMRTHDVMHETGGPITHGYFVNTGLASILSLMADGKSVEVGLVGKEGFAGLPLVVGLRTSPNRVVTQVEGTAFKVSAAHLAEVLRRCPQLERRLNRYSQDLAMQATQVAACNRLHEVHERLARWLLMSQDRIGTAVVPLTQEFLAHMLGTRRASVTVAAGILQKAGLINYTRGEVKIISRRNLEDAACECYAVMTRQSRLWQKESQ